MVCEKSNIGEVMIKFVCDDEKRNGTSKKYVERWKETHEFLENLRRENIRRSNVEDSICAFEDVFLASLELSANKPTSGLTEFHKILAKTL